jgi:CDP-diacylglycerol--glycerol-3-phosphate 3-phosphatidyltransferase
VAQTAEKRRRLTLTDQMRIRFKGILDPLGGFFNRIGLMPNTMTLLGLSGTILGAVFLAQEG